MCTVVRSVRKDIISEIRIKRIILSGDNMKKYVTGQMLSCIENNQIFPQDVQITNNQYITFGSYGLTLVKYTKCKIKEKHLNGYRSMNAEEINAELNNMEWIDKD